MNSLCFHISLLRCPPAVLMWTYRRQAAGPYPGVPGFWTQGSSLACEKCPTAVHSALQGDTARARRVMRMLLKGAALRFS